MTKKAILLVIGIIAFIITLSIAASYTIGFYKDKSNQKHTKVEKLDLTPLDMKYAPMHDSGCVPFYSLFVCKNAVQVISYGESSKENVRVIYRTSYFYKYVKEFKFNKIENSLYRISIIRSKRNNNAPLESFTIHEEVFIDFLNALSSEKIDFSK